VAEEVEKADAIEEVADSQDEVRPACEEVAEEKRLIPYWEVVKKEEAERTQSQVADVKMEIDERYDRFVRDLVPND